MELVDRAPRGHVDRHAGIDLDPEAHGRGHAADLPRVQLVVAVAVAVGLERAAGADLDGVAVDRERDAAGRAEPRDAREARLDHEAVIERLVGAARPARRAVGGGGIAADLPARRGPVGVARGIVEREERGEPIAGERGPEIARVADAVGQLQRHLGLRHVRLARVGDRRAVVAGVADAVAVLVVLADVRRDGQLSAAFASPSPSRSSGLASGPAGECPHAAIASTTIHLTDSSVAPRIR